MFNTLKIKKQYFILCLGVVFSSCLTNIDEEQEIDPCTTVTFSTEVKPIIDANCVQCHGTGGNFPNLTTYQGVSGNASNVKSQVVSRKMPIGSTLTDAEIQAISCWVDAGAINN